jgi:hypothetical protein
MAASEQARASPPCALGEKGGKLLAGFRSKNPLGFNRKPIYDAGMTGFFF